jgi:hypothetical protein
MGAAGPRYGYGLTDWSNLSLSDRLFNGIANNINNRITNKNRLLSSG